MALIQMANQQQAVAALVVGIFQNFLKYLFVTVCLLD